jgi:hypothetical protein
MYFTELHEAKPYRQFCFHEVPCDVDIPKFRAPIALAPMALMLLALLCRA